MSIKQTTNRSATLTGRVSRCDNSRIAASGVYVQYIVENETLPGLPCSTIYIFLCNGRDIQLTCNRIKSTESSLTFNVNGVALLFRFVSDRKKSAIKTIAAIIMMK